MRSMWKGVISFGLVSIPVKVYTAVGSEHSVSFHQLHKTDEGRVRYQKVCELDGKQLDQSDIVRGFEAADGSVAVVTDRELERLPLPSAHTVELHGFLDWADVDPMMISKPYYLAPDGPGGKPYVLLRDTLAARETAAVAKVALRGREILTLVRPEGEMLVLHQLYWPDEIRSPEGLAPGGRVRGTDAELKMAGQLVDALGRVDLADFRDEYADAVAKLVDAKLQGKKPPKADQAPPRTKAVDLMAALRDSVDAAQKSRRTDGKPRGRASGRHLSAVPSEDASTTKAPAKKKAASKPAAKKSAARKTAAKKTAGRKTTPRKSPTRKTSAGKTTRKQPAPASAKASG